MTPNGGPSFSEATLWEGRSGLTILTRFFGTRLDLHALVSCSPVFSPPSRFLGLVRDRPHVTQRSSLRAWGGRRALCLNFVAASLRAFADFPSNILVP